MAHSTWSIRDAKNFFNEVVAAARRKPQTVTKNGKPAVVILSADEYDRLIKLAHLRSSSFAEMLLAMPRGKVDFERSGTKPRDVTL
jgi:antitoxin Phd